MGATGNSAVNAAQASNTAQQAQIQASIDAINKAYSSPARTAGTQAYGKALGDQLTQNVNDQEAVNARNLKFAMARSGLTGGSAAVDSNTQLQKDYSQGLLEASQQAQAGTAALQQADNSSKNQLISLAEQGGYTGTIPSQSASATAAGLNTAQSYAGPAGLNNLFSGTAQIYQNEEQAAAQRKAQINPIGSIYGAPSVISGGTN
jgi:hypothetical protein